MTETFRRVENIIHVITAKKKFGFAVSLYAQSGFHPVSNPSKTGVVKNLAPISAYPQMAPSSRAILKKERITQPSTKQASRPAEADQASAYQEP
jgi:hypothetical protein